MEWTWSKHLYALSGIVSIVGLAVGLVFLVGNKAQTQVIVPQNTSAGLLAPVP
jgi:hypothetical protein